MEQEKLEGMLIDYIDGKLTEAAQKEVEHELAQHESSRRLYAELKEVLGAFEKSTVWEPSMALKNNFEQALSREIAAVQSEHNSPAGKQVSFHPILYRAAAAVILVIIGVGIGYWVNKNQEQQAELASIRKEMESTKRIMMAMLDNQQSASQRVLGATAAYHMEKADDQIITALVKTMNDDPNTNVRMAALEALGKFSHQTEVRKALIVSLGTQKDPIVQIALIQLLVKMREKSAVKDLEKIVDDAKTMKAVKDEAYSGLMKLS
jgi:hypothetical protein